MRERLQIGQMIVVDQEMDLYSRRPEHQLDFDDMLFSILNERARPGDILTVVGLSEPRFPRDDVWYAVIDASGRVAWLMACHSGVFYDSLPADCN